MAFTRKMLKAMGITEEQIEQIMDAHIEVVDALKSERDTFKESAEKFESVDKELKALKEKGGNWQEKYEKEHSDFEAYKTAQKDKETLVTKRDAYKALLAETGISEKRIDSILKVTDLSSVELDEAGKIKDSSKHTESIKSEWADFITSTSTTGASTKTPPSNVGAGKTYQSKADIMKIADRNERRQAIKENPNLFGLSTGE